MRPRQSNGSRLNRPIIISAIGHVILLITLISVPGLNLPFRDKPMRIDVMWTELPRGTSDDIGLGMKKAESLPKSTIEEQKNTFQPDKPEQQTIKPQMSAPAVAPKQEEQAKAKDEPRPKIDTSKMTKMDDKAKPIKPTKGDAKIKNALAMIDKQLAGRQVVPEAGQVSKNNDGYKYGTSDKPLRVAPSDPEYLKYQAMVRARIIREWIVPTVYGEEGGPRFNARLEVLINMDGDVVSVRWAKQSGNSSFDQSAMRAVKQSSPFPKPPDRLAWEAYNEGFLIEFDPRMKPQ